MDGGGVVYSFVARMDCMVDCIGADLHRTFLFLSHLFVSLFHSTKNKRERHAVYAFGWESMLLWNPDRLLLLGSFAFCVFGLICLHRFGVCFCFGFRLLVAFWKLYAKEKEREGREEKGER